MRLEALLLLLVVVGLDSYYLTPKMRFSGSSVEDAHRGTAHGTAHYHDGRRCPTPPLANHTAAPGRNPHPHYRHYLLLIAMYVVEVEWRGMDYPWDR